LAHRQVAQMGLKLLGATAKPLNERFSALSAPAPAELLSA